MWDEDVSPIFERVVGLSHALTLLFVGKKKKREKEKKKEKKKRREEEEEDDRSRASRRGEII